MRNYQFDSFLVDYLVDLNQAVLSHATTRSMGSKKLDSFKARWCSLIAEAGPSTLAPTKL